MSPAPRRSWPTPRPRWRTRRRLRPARPRARLAPPSTTTTTLVPPATINRVKQAEADFAKTSEGITDSTPLVQATASFNSAALALEIAWLKLLADAGCLTDEQQAQAVAKVTDYTTALQTQLQQAGYYKDPIDGIYGPQTVAAVQQLQTDNGLPTTGFVDQATALALDKKLAELGQQAAAQELTQTAAVQTVLKLTGYWTGPIDGKWTPGAHRLAEEVPDRARRPTHRSGRRRHVGRFRTGPRQPQDHRDHDHDDEHHDPTTTTIAGTTPATTGATTTGATTST